MSSESLNDGIFLILYILPLLILTVFYATAPLSFFRVNSSNFFLISFLVYNHFGMLFLSFPSSPHININDTTTYLVLTYNSIVALIFCVTKLIFPTNRFEKVVSQKSLVETNIKYNFLWLFLFLCVFFAYQRFASAPLSSYLFQNLSSADLLQLREADLVSGSKLLGIKTSFLNILFHALFVMCVMSLAKAFTCFRAQHFIFTILGIFVWMVWFGANLSKGFLLQLFVGFIALISLIYFKGSLLNRITIISLLIFMFCSMFIVKIFMGGELNLFYAFERAFLGNLRPHYAVIDHFSFDNLLYGATAPGWWTFRSNDVFNLDGFTWNLLNQSTKGSYSAPSSFVADAHANFHILGVFVYSIVGIVILRLFDMLITRLRNPLVCLGLIVWGSSFLSYIAVAPIYIIITSYYFWGVIIIFLIFYRLSLKVGSKHRFVQQKLN